MNSLNVKINQLAGVVIVVIGATLIANQITRRPKKLLLESKPPVLQQGRSTLVRLLREETESLIYSPSISTITFYNGLVSCENLKRKVLEIIVANPWLRARLVKSKELGEIAALYPTEFSPKVDCYDFFDFVVDDGISSELSYTMLVKKVNNLLVKRGSDCIGRNEPLFRVILVQIEENAKYAMVVSLSHVLGDRHTFYCLHSQLDSHTGCKSLVVERNHDFARLLDQSCSAKLNKWLTSSCLQLSKVTTLLFGSTPRVWIHELDMSEVSNRKKLYAQQNTDHNTLVNRNTSGVDVDAYGNVSEVGSSDVIASWFMSRCRSSFGLMAVDCRRLRLETTITDDHAGNYETIFVYQGSDFSLPNYIRASLTRCSPDTRFATRSDSVPSLLQTLFFNCSLVSDWASFYKDVNLGDRSQLAMHLPLLSLSDSQFRDQCVVFRIAGCRTAILAATRGNAINKFMHCTNKLKKSCGELVAQRGFGLSVDGQDTAILGDRLLE